VVGKGEAAGISTVGPLSVFSNRDVRLHLVGGKGGVGKTTIAAALAVHLARQFPKRRYLVLSTGPSHSLSGILDVPLSSPPSPVPGAANLFAVELEAAGLLVKFKNRYSKALRLILCRGTFLDDEDISRFLELSFPGLDELTAMLELIDFLDSGGYDSIIVDAAPTGHALRLLSLPLLTSVWVSMLDRMLDKHRLMSELSNRHYRKDEADQFIDKLNHDLDRASSLFRTPELCQFLVVTLLEPVVTAETDRLVEVLGQRGIGVSGLIANRLLPFADGCRACRSAHFEQQRLLRALAHRRPQLPIAALPEVPHEIRGQHSLANFLGALVWPEECAPLNLAPCRPSSHSPVTLTSPEEGRQFSLFCGHGGVGKSTLACAYALQLSRLYPERKVLLFSTDPAHSLSDCFEQEIGPTGAFVNGTGNLFAREIDPEVLFAGWKEAYSRQIDGASEEAAAVRLRGDVIRDLLDLTPPGLDELMCLAELADSVQREEYDFYVLDTAPGGHTLRFLELPAVIREWLRTIFQILLKYRELARSPQASEVLVEMSQRVRRIQHVFADPGRCEAIPVAVPAPMALQETGCLLSALRKAGVRTQRLFLNQVITSPDGCARCRPAALRQQHEIQRFREVLAELDIVEFPRVDGVLRGPGPLGRLLQFAAAPELMLTEAGR